MTTEVIYIDSKKSWKKFYSLYIIDLNIKLNISGYRCYRYV